MTVVFNLAMSFVHKWEGGEKYTNDKDVPGGETKFGIFKRAYPNVDSKSLTRAGADHSNISDYLYGKPPF